MHIVIPHTTSRAQAKAQIETLLRDAHSKMEGQAEIHEERWEGDTLHFDVSAQGQRISGQLAIEDAQFVLDAKLPLMLRLFEGRIEREIAAQVKNAQLNS